MRVEQKVPGWRDTALGDVGIWLSGGTPSKTRPDYWNGDVPWLSPKDMKQFDVADIQDSITEQAVRDGARTAEPGSIFIVVRGMILAHTFPVCIAKRRVAFNQDVKALFLAAQHDGRFLAHWLAGNEHRMLGLVSEATHGTKKIELPLLLGQRLACPPLPEQRAIAAVLDTIDDAIQKTEQIIAKLQQVKQGLLHDLLTRGIDDNGELRDPERHPEQFQDSPLGRIPKGWDVVPIGSLAIGGIVNGVFKEPGRAGRGVPLVNVGDLYGDFGVDLDRVERFDATAAERIRFGVRSGDIYFTRSSLNLAGIAHCNIVRSVDKEAVFECHLMRLRTDARRANCAFVALWCRAALARDFLMARAKQVTMTTIAQPDIYPLPTPLPPRQEQQQIVDAIDSMDALLAREALYAEKMRAEKQAVANDLLTGKVRTSSLAEVGT